MAGLFRLLQPARITPAGQLVSLLGDRRLAGAGDTDEGNCLYPGGSDSPVLFDPFAARSSNTKCRTALRHSIDRPFTKRWTLPKELRSARGLPRAPHRSQEHPL